MYIVTGGAGFIGSAIVNRLNKEGIEDILIVDHLGESEKWKNLRALKYIDYIEKDLFLEELEECPEKLSEVECIIHMGACSSTTEKDATYLINNNFEYTKRLAEFAIYNNIRFIYASSAATYGDGELGYSDIDENIEQFRPLNMYGYSKQMFDIWAKKNNILNKIAGIKFFNIFGPNEYHKGDMRSMIHKAYNQIKNTGRVNLFKSDKEEYEDGEQKRDFFYIKNAVEMVLFLVNNKTVNGIFNVGSGEANSWNILMKAIFKALNKPAHIDYIEMPSHLKGKYQYYTKADISKIKESGFDKDLLSLEESVKDYVLNYLEKDKHLGDE